MANTRGGTIVLNAVACDPRHLDSATWDNTVNKYVAPRVMGITSIQPKPDQCEIAVPESSDKPHIFITDTTYEDQSGRHHSAFYAGQVYVRHGSKTEPATDDDLRRIIQEMVRLWLTRVAEAIQKLSLEIGQSSGALPVRLSDEALLESRIVDPNKDYPYTARTLGTELGRNQNWVARALDMLGIKDDPRYCLTMTGASDKVVLRKYNQTALVRLREILEVHPNFSPFASSPS